MEIVDLLSPVSDESFEECGNQRISKEFPSSTAAFNKRDRGIFKKSFVAEAHVNARPADTNGRTALQAAAEGGYIHIVKRLLDSGANVNDTAPAQDGESTALQAAAGKGHKDIVELLIKRGAKVTEREGYVALKAAAGGGYIDTIDILTSYKAEVNIPGILQAAAHGGHLMMVEHLIYKGADVNATVVGKVGTALSAAAIRGYDDIVILLISKGAIIDQRGESGNTALQVAAERGQRQIVELLVKKGADINAIPADDGRTALQAASEGGQLQTAELLIRQGADVNAAPAAFSGYTALQVAVLGGTPRGGQAIGRQ